MARRVETLTIEVEGANNLRSLEEDLINVRNRIRETRREINKMKEEGRDTRNLERTATTLSQQQQDIQQELTRTRREVRQNIDSWKEFERNLPKDSLIAMKRELAENVRALGAMSRAERESARGKELINKIKETRDELKKVEASYGQFGRNVGNYASAFAGIGTQILRGFGIVGGVNLVVRGLRDATSTVMEYSQANANLRAILRQTSEETALLREQQQELGASTAFTATQVTEMQTELAKLGFLQQEILDATEGIINFAIATETDIPRAANVAGSALRSFGLEATEIDRVVSVLGVSTTMTSLDFSKLEAGLPIVSGVAAEFGASIEEVTAQLGVLSDRGITAATAATALRNVYLKSSRAGMTFSQSLDKIANAADPVNEAFELFDVRGALQATILALNREEADELTESLRGLGDELQVMADERMATLRGRLILLDSAWQGFILSLSDGTGIFSREVRGLVDQLTHVLNTLTRINKVASFGEFFEFVSGRTRFREEFAEYNRKRRREAGLTIEDSPFTSVIFGDPTTGVRPWDVNELSSEEKRLLRVLDIEERILELARKKAEEEAKSSKQKEIFQENTIKWLEQEIKLREDLIVRTTDESEINRLTHEVMELTFKLEEARESVKKLKDDIREEREREISRALWMDLGEAATITPGGLIAPAMRSKAVKKQEEENKKRIDKHLKHIMKVNNRIIKLRSDARKRELREEERQRIRFERELFREIGNLTHQTGDLLIGLVSQRHELELDWALSNIDREYDARMKAARGIAEAEMSLAEEVEERKEEVRKRAFEREKRLAIATAIINSASAVISAWKDGFLAPVRIAGIVASTALEIAKIQSTSYEKGGFTSSEGVPDPKVPGRKIVGVVHDHEYVIPKHIIEEVPEVVYALEQRRLRGFADGGFTSPISYDVLSRGATPSPSVNLNAVYEAVYRGTLAGSTEGSVQGLKEGEKYRSLQQMRKQAADKNITN